MHEDGDYFTILLSEKKQDAELCARYHCFCKKGEGNTDISIYIMIVGCVCVCVHADTCEHTHLRYIQIKSF